MACNTHENTLNDLKKRGIVAEDRSILDMDEFNRLNEKYSQIANIKYGVDGDLFSIETKTIPRNEQRRTPTQIINRAVANLDMFKKLNLAVDTHNNLKKDEVNPPVEEKAIGEVERIMTTDTEIERHQFESKPDFSKVEITAPQKKEVVDKMQNILTSLGIKIQTGNLPADIASMTDSINRLITFAEGHLTDDNLTEEALHLVVDILEQKDNPLFQKLMGQVWKYRIYQQVLDEYSGLDLYKKDGKTDFYKLKKEAIAQLLTQKLLSDHPIDDDKGWLAAAWDAISKFLQRTFLGLPANTRDDFSKLADDIMKTDFITDEDKKLIGTDKYYAKKNNRQKEFSSSKRKFGANRQLGEDFTNKSAEDIKNYIKKMADSIERVVEQEVNPETGQMEEVEFYKTLTGLKDRVTSVLSRANAKLYQNVDKSERATALREAKLQRGTAVHKTFEDLFRRFIDPNTDQIKKYPDLEPVNKEVSQPVYNKLQAIAVGVLRSYPQGTYFLIETKGVNEHEGVAGTMDFLAITPDKKVHLLDWKTVDTSFREHGVTKHRMDISPFNQAYWRDQLETYKSMLVSYGLTIANIAQVRAVPVVTETVVSKIDKNKPLSVDNSLITIANVKIREGNIPGIEDPTTMDVPVYYESTGNQAVDKEITKLWGIYQQIQTRVYKPGERARKNLDLQRISLAIREIQVKGTATKFTSLFDDSFARYNLLSKKKLAFLDNVKDGQPFWTEEQNNELNAHLSELHDAYQFVSAFDEFPEAIRKLYEGNTITTSKTDLASAVRLGNNAKAIRTQLEASAQAIMNKLGDAYGVHNVWDYDVDKKFDFFGRMLTSMLHREEKSIQLASRMVKAMAFLAKQEAQKYFSEKGKFVITREAIEKWASENGVNVREAYDKIFKWTINEYKYNGATYKKDGDKYYRNKTEITAKDYFNTYGLNKKSVSEEKRGRAESLISIINSEFYDMLDTKQRELTELYNEEDERLTSLNYKGRNKAASVKDFYKNKVIPFLQEHFDLKAYDADYKTALEKQIENLNAETFDVRDPVADELIKRNLIENWIAQHNIYTSPQALSSSNWLLRVNQAKWQSPEYTELQKPENKALLDTYNLFTSIATRAYEAGMLDDVYNPKRFVPLIENKPLVNIDNPFSKANLLQNTGTVVGTLGIGLTGSLVGPAFGVLMGGGYLSYRIGSSIYKSFKENYLPSDDDRKSSPDVSLITGEPILKRKTPFKSFENESRLDPDLFANYKKLMDHVIKFEMINQFESRFSMTRLMEATKSYSYGTNDDGSIAYQKTVSGLEDRTKRKEVENQGTTKADLDRYLHDQMYSGTLDNKPSWSKVADLIQNLAVASMIGLNATSQTVNILGIESSGTLQKGRLFDNWDFEQAMNRTFGIEGLMAMLPGAGIGLGVGAITGMPILGVAAAAVATHKFRGKIAERWQRESSRRINYMKALLQSRLATQHDSEGLNKFRDTWKTKLQHQNIIFWGYEKGDHWGQDAITDAILQNTKVVNGHFVNINEEIKAKYKDERYRGTRGQRLAVEKKINKEIKAEKKNSIYHTMKKDGDAYDIGIDLTTQEGINELNNLSSRIHSYIKSTLGNVDENDKNLIKMMWAGKFLTALKNWVFRVYGHRISGLEYDKERGESTLGRYIAFYDAVKYKPLAIFGEVAKSLGGLLAYMNPVLGVIGVATSNRAKESVKYNVNIQEAGRARYNVEKAKAIETGKDMSKFPSEEEFIDLYVNGVRNTITAVQQLAMIYAGVVLINSIFGGAKPGSPPNPKKDWEVYTFARLLFGLTNELGGDKDPNQLSNLVSGGGRQGMIVGLSYLTDIANFGVDFGKEVIGEVGDKVNKTFHRHPKINSLGQTPSQEMMSKAHPLHHFVMALPGVRQIHQHELATSPKYRKFFEQKVVHHR